MHDNMGDQRVGSGMNSCSPGTMPMRPTLQSRLACSMRFAQLDHQFAGQDRQDRAGGL